MEPATALPGTIVKPNFAPVNHVPFTINRGPFGRVENVRQLIEFRNASEVNCLWVYSPDNGPFSALGQEKISKIVNQQSELDPVQRLNAKITTFNSKIYKKVFSYLKKPADPQNPVDPQIPVDLRRATLAFQEITHLFDWNKLTLIQKLLDKIVKGNADFTAIDRFVSLGGDLNAPFKYYYYNQCNGSPLSYLFHLCHWDANNTTKRLTGYIVQKGAKVNLIFGPKEDNFISSIAHTSLFSSLVFHWYFKNRGDMNFQNGDGNSFLHLVLYRPNIAPICNIAAAAELVKMNIDVSLANKKGDHPIHLLCRYGYSEEALDLLKALLEKAPDELCATDGEGRTPLYWSIRTGKLSFIKTILAAKNIESSKENFNELLKSFIAFIAEDSRKFKYVGNNTEFNQKLIEGSFTGKYVPILNSIISLAEYTCKNLRSVLIVHEGDSTLLHHLAKSCPFILDYFLKEKYILLEDLQLINSQGETVRSIANRTNNTFLLAIACYNHDVDAVRKLMNEDISLDFRVDDNVPLLHATFKGCNLHGWKTGLQIFNLLLAKGIDPNLADNDGTTALHWAIDTASCLANPVITMLLDYNADVTLADNRGKTPEKLIQGYRSWDVPKNAILGAPYK